MTERNHRFKDSDITKEKTLSMYGSQKQLMD